LSPEDCEQLEQLAGAGWTMKDLALFFRIHLTRFTNCCLYDELEEGSIRYHYERGIVLRRAAVDLSLSWSAEGGNLTAIQIYKKEMEKIELEKYKEGILDGRL